MKSRIDKENYTNVAKKPHNLCKTSKKLNIKWRESLQAEKMWYTDVCVPM